MPKKRIHLEKTVTLTLTTAERNVLLKIITGLPSKYRAALRAKGPLRLTLEDLYDIAGYIAAEANHTDHERLQQSLDGIVSRIFTGTMPKSLRNINIKDADTDKQLARQTVRVAEWAKAALFAAEQLRIKSQSIDRFPLKKDARAVLATARRVSPRLKKKLGQRDATFTFAEAIHMAEAVVKSLPDADPLQQIALLLISKSLMEFLQEHVVRAASAQKLSVSDTRR